MAGGSIQEGFRCEPTFLGVRIVQEQQAHGSSGRFERSSLMMISIIQAICANRRRVFIRLLKSTRLAAQPVQRSPKITIVLWLCSSLYPVSMSWSQSEEMCNINESDSYPLC